MKRGQMIVYIIIIIILIGMMAIGFFVYNSQKEGVSVSNSCTELGCESNEIYVGSINSDKYYECDCHYAKQIKPENIICFSSDSEAENKGYIKSEC